MTHSTTDQRRETPIGFTNQRQGISSILTTVQMTDAQNYPLNTVLNFSALDSSNRQGTEGPNNETEPKPVIKAKRRTDPLKK